MSDFIDHLASTKQSVIVEFALVLTLIRVAAHYYLKNVEPHRRVGLFSVVRWINELADAVIYAAIFVFLVIRPYLGQAFKIPTGSMVSTLNVNDFIVANKLIYRYSDPKAGDIVVFRPPKNAILDKSQIDADGNVTVDYVKRCIGVPGDTIEIKNRVLYRNGVALKEPYAHYEKCMDPDPNACVNYAPLSDDERNSDPASNLDFKLVLHHGKPWPVQIEGQLANINPVFTAPNYLAQNGAESEELYHAAPIQVPKGFYLMMGDDRNNSYDGRCWGLVPRSAIIGRAEFIWLPISRITKLKFDTGTPIGQ